MGVDDYLDREAGIVAAATAAAVSPRARELFRRGAVYGLAGVLKVGDMAAGTAKGAVRGAKDGASSAAAGLTKPAPRRQQSRRAPARSQQRRRSTRSA